MPRATISLPAAHVHIRCVRIPRPRFFTSPPIAVAKHKKVRDGTARVCTFSSENKLISSYFAEMTARTPTAEREIQDLKRGAEQHAGPASAGERPPQYVINRPLKSVETRAL